MSTDSEVLQQPIPGSLGELAKILEEKPWAVALPENTQLAQKSLEVTKDIFDLGISLESLSHTHLHPFLLSILEPPSVNLRSSSKKKAASPPPVDPESFLPYTPLSVLTVDGLDPEQVWAQLELRSEGISKVVKEVGSGENNLEDEDAEQDAESDDDEDESEEEMSVEEFRRMLIESGEEGVEDLDDEEIMALMEDFETDEDSDEDESDIKFKDEDEDDESLEGDSDDEDMDNEDEEELASDEDALDGELGSDDELSLGEDEEGDEEEEDDGDDDEDEEEDKQEFDEEDDDTSALFAAGPSQPKGKKTRGHPTLDDQFFSIDEFNRQTEEAEAERVTSGRLGGDDDEEEELEDVGAMMLEAPGDDEDIGYADFFAPPRGSSSATGKGKGKEQSKGKGKDKKGKGKSKGARFDEDALMEQAEEEEEEEEGQARGVFGRVKGDLFDSDDEEEEAEKNLSTHEKRQIALANQIAELESEAIGPKDWTLMGEATSRARPENSLLEENLDFEQVSKVVPVITEESVKSLEDIIKARILDNNFDSPVRVRAYEPTPFLPSRYFELQDTQSTKSLAQIYEEEYQAAATGGKAQDPRDQKLKKEHEEIETIWNDICYKLDALSSLNFVPKAPKAQITTISDLPTTTMESALPPTAAASTMLAPQELFAPPAASSLVARSELTPEEAQKARQKARKAKQSEQKKLGDMADLYGNGKKKRKSVREEKDDALKSLVKSGKGVTVVGKGAKEFGKAAKRGAGPDDGSREDGKRLKL